jgi:hypothetical protein
MDEVFGTHRQRLNGTVGLHMAEVHNLSKQIVASSFINEAIHACDLSYRSIKKDTVKLAFCS